jgi:hypothetical protein
MNVIANAEDGKSMFKPAGTTAAGYWDLSGDMTGTLMPAGTASLLPVDGGANNTAKAFNIKGAMHTGWGAALAAEVANGCPFDGSKYGGISFYAKGTSTVFEGPNKLLIAIGMPEFIPSINGGFLAAACTPTSNDPLCYARHRVTIDLTADWKQYIIAWEDLVAPAYLNGAGPAFGANRIRDIVFNASGPSGDATMMPATFDFWIDEVQFVPTGTKGNVGGMGAAGASSGGASSGGAGGASAGAGGASAGAGGVSSGAGGASAGTGG